MYKHKITGVVVKAFCLDGSCLPDWFCDLRSAGTARTYNQGTGNPFHDPITHVEIDINPTFTLIVSRGNWIINNDTNIFFHNPAIFNATYTPV